MSMIARIIDTTPAGTTQVYEISYVSVDLGARECMPGQVPAYACSVYEDNIICFAVFLSLSYIP